MTLPSPPNPIDIVSINTELGVNPPQVNTGLVFLNSYILPAQRPAAPNLKSFYGLTYFQNNNNGNCNNANITNCNCNCGNIQCNATANCQNINCANCDTQSWLQTNCNCACTYNCNSNQNCYSYACNCSKIICSKLFQIGLLRAETYAADQQYGEWLREADPEVYEGYIRWASTVVDWMDGRGPTFMPWIRDPEARARAQSDMAIRWTKRIATPWAEHMMFLMGMRKVDNDIGRTLMAIGRPISRMVNRLPRDRDLGALSTMTMLLIFFGSYYLATAKARMIHRVSALFSRIAKHGSAN